MATRRRRPAEAVDTAKLLAARWTKGPWVRKGQQPSHSEMCASRHRRARALAQARARKAARAEREWERR